MAAGGVSDPYDWNNPEHIAAEFFRRAKVLQTIRADKSGRTLALLKTYYRDHPWQLIDDWGTTVDPRNSDAGSAFMPFKLFPKQVEWCKWVVDRWEAKERGLTEKSRDAGVSWLSVSLACALAVTREGFTAGFGSRKEEYVDLLGSPKSLFWKAREFMKGLPPEFRAGWTPAHAPHKRLSFPETGSVITGEAGDGIGRGDRASIYFVDEAAFLERPMLVEASLSQTTNCRIDISTPNGMANPFATKRHSLPERQVFTLHWRDDLRKGDEWYAKQQADLDPVTLAQEVDLSYTASVTGVLIPAAWVQSAVDAHVKLGIPPTGERRGALDVADEGIDLNAFAWTHGIVLEDVTAWSGKGDDIFATVATTFQHCDDHGIRTFDYDADGLGAGVRGDARVLNESRSGRKLNAEPFRGSGAVWSPDAPIPTATPGTGRDRSERINKDFFQNAKAQAWWSLRLRFQRTHRAVTDGSVGEYDPDDLISLSAGMSQLSALTMELSQPTYSLNGTGKVVVDKAPDGTRSPNRADAVMIAFAPRKTGAWFDRLYGA